MMYLSLQANYEKTISQKKEWVLKGGTVLYLNYEDIRRAIDYDIQQEKEFNYAVLSLLS